VLYILVDDLRADQMSAYGYERDTTPWLRAQVQSGQARLVKRFYANSVCTLAGTQSLLASQEIESNRPGRYTLLDLLHEHGWEISALLSGDHNAGNHQRERWGHIDHLFDEGDFEEWSFGDDGFVFERLRTLLPYLRRERPQFIYLHLLAAHEEGRFNRAFTRWRPGNRSLWSHLFGQPASLAETFRANYDNKVLQADAEVSRLVAMVRQWQAGRGRELQVHLVSDHGESLGEHNRVGHLYFMYEENLRVPWIILDPKGTYRNLEFAQALDFAPTLARRLGLPIPPQWQGRPLQEPNLPRAFLAQMPDDRRDWVAVTTLWNGGYYRYMKKKVWADPRREQFYNLLADPGELHSLLPAQASHPVVQASRDRVNFLLRRQGLEP
jgi:arylsulfatase A-like enzyme